jgi:iron complex outermembrane recepter protein
MRKGGIPYTLGSALVATWLVSTASASAAPRADRKKPASSRQAVSAQSPQAQTDTPEGQAAIIVTAQKRQELLLKVPLSITAIGARTLEEKGVRSLEELSRSVPGLAIRSGGENAPTIFSIRGVGPEFNTAATVAVYVDDTPITVGTNSPDLKIFDVDRIEVLRGPQGTLFGSSAMGGAIRYVSPTPPYSIANGRARVEGSKTAHGDGNYEAQGALGVPLSGSLGVRASAFYRRDSGFIDVVDEATGEVVRNNVNSADSYGGRMALGARLSSTANAVLSLIYQDTRRHDLDFSHNVRESGGVITPLKPLQKTERVRPSTRDRFLMPNLLINVDVGSARITSSSSYQHERSDLTNDASYFIEGLFGLPPDLGDQIVDPVPRTRYFKAYVQELRIASTDTGRFQWLGGIYYRNSKFTSHQVFGSNIEELFGLPADLFLPGGAIEQFDESSRVTEVAGFGEASLKLHALKLTAGTRYSQLTRTVHQAELFAPLLGPNAPPVVEKSRDRPFTPKVSASYDLGSDSMVYVMAAKGFREGGPNPPLFMSADCQAALAALGLKSAPTSYKSDSLWSYEVGAKGRLAHRAITFQGSLYQIDWKDIQQSLALGQQCGNSPVANFGSARIQGTDLNVDLLVAPGFTIDAIMNYYFKAELTKDRITGTDPVTGQPIIGARAGTPLSYVPKFTATAAARYQWRVGANTRAFVRGEIQHVAAANRYVATTGANPDLRAPSYNVVAGRAGLLFNGYEVDVFGDNLLDARPYIAVGGGFAPGGAEGVARTTIRPRTIGVSLSKSF